VTQIVVNVRQRTAIHSMFVISEGTRALNSVHVIYCTATRIVNVLMTLVVWQTVDAVELSKNIARTILPVNLKEVIIVAGLCFSTVAVTIVNVENMTSLVFIKRNRRDFCSVFFVLLGEAFSLQRLVFWLVLNLSGTELFDAPLRPIV